MPFDPFGVQRYHEDVKARIARGEAGLAQSYIGRSLVSYEINGHGPGVFTGNVGVGGDPLDEMILDVARDEGIASSKVFDRGHVEWMIRDREAYPKHFPARHKQAKRLKSLLDEQPGLFF